VVLPKSGIAAFQLPESGIVALLESVVLQESDIAAMDKNLTKKRKKVKNEYSLCSVFFATGLNFSCSVVNATFVVIVVKLQATLPR